MCQLQRRIFYVLFLLPDRSALSTQAHNAIKSASSKCEWMMRCLCGLPSVIIHKTHRQATGIEITQRAGGLKRSRLEGPVLPFSRLMGNHHWAMSARKASSSSMLLIELITENGGLLSGRTRHSSYNISSSPKIPITADYNIRVRAGKHPMWCGSKPGTHPMTPEGLHLARVTRRLHLCLL